MFEIVQNELGNVSEEDVVLPLLELMIMGKKNQIKLRKENYEKLLKANDIYTWGITNKSFRFGLSKEQKICFTYYNDNNQIQVYKYEEEDFIKKFKKINF